MKKWRVVLSLALAVVLVLSLLSGCTSNTKQQSQQSKGAEKNANFKVGLVTDVGGINDHSFNQLAYQGLEKAKKDLGVTTNFIQSKQQTDYVTNLTQFAQQKYNMIIAVGFLMKDAVEQVSKQFPDSKFMIIDSDITDRPNVASASFKTEQCGYLVGVMAGLMEKEKTPKLNSQNVVGVVGGMQIPPVDSYIAGFQQGVKVVNPDTKVLVSYTGNFNDPASGKQMALTQISQGADIVFGDAGQTGDGVINAAKEKNIYAIGVDADQNYMAPETVMTSALKRVDVSTYDIIKNTLDNKFKSGMVYFDLSNDGIGFGKPISDVPQSIIDKVNEYANQIKDGKITVSDKVQK